MNIMTAPITTLINSAYSAFNARDIDAALTTFHPQILWPKAFEGGYVKGHAEIREYWTRQWNEINPKVEPISIKQRQNGIVEVQVHQLVTDLEGKELFNGSVKHIYTIQNKLLAKMDIELA
ncbi:nuclear transport factor 2 family protein [Fluviicola taffensis]|uniref:SnoaL-like domain-containing protein n=1 Tax=Fluviicola taffensis (strain DSM 16823 / NCIMB 13979 / RW262) TaxID=755732 RepID=F2IHX2_FLUTR|nr:nuclear transport factor 2 family protein [Fluviicola taffensis]AEA45931.1 hypothetical protein Fluta_3967 [Fluviicola taffensis DSM 16823]